MSKIYVRMLEYLALKDDSCLEHAKQFHFESVYLAQGIRSNNVAINRKTVQFQEIE